MTFCSSWKTPSKPNQSVSQYMYLLCLLLMQHHILEKLLVSLLDRPLVDHVLVNPQLLCLLLGRQLVDHVLVNLLSLSLLLQNNTKVDGNKNYLLWHFSVEYRSTETKIYLNYKPNQSLPWVDLPKTSRPWTTVAPCVPLRWVIPLPLCDPTWTKKEKERRTDEKAFSR